MKKETEIIKSKSIEKGYRKLGYSKLDSAEITEGLNQLLCDLHIFNQKVKAYHWNVTGDDFFDLHEKFEELYTLSNGMIDEIAERVRIFGHTPTTLLSEYVKNAQLKEHQNNETSFQMMKTLRNDMEVIIEDMIRVTEHSIDAGDIGSQDMMSNMIREIEKLHWMFSAYLQ